MKENKRIFDDQLKKTTGGAEDPHYWGSKCDHPSLIQYDEYREKSYFVFWSIRQRKCRCEVCFEEIWIDV